MLAVHDAVRTVGTGGEALAAADAACGIEFDLRPHDQRFGIVAPGAAVVAALEEHGGADTGPVVHGKALHIKERTGLTHENASFMICE